jgi:UDP-glucose:(heptosyl)LPS alpha-1,3-glucosyltransferase
VFRRRYLAHGGGERFTQEFLRRIAGAGHQVHLFCQQWTAAPEGVSTHRVPAFPGGSALGTLAYALLAPRLARSVNVDLTHSFERTVSQDLYRAGEGCHRQWLALRRQHLPGPVPALDRLRPFHRVVLAIERRICQKGGAGLLIVNSAMVEADFALHYASLSAPTVLIRNGVDLDRFHPEVRASARAAARQSLGLQPDELALLSVGSGFWRKGVPTVIRALGKLRRRTRLAPVLLVAGKGNPEFLRSLASREGVDRQLRVLGVVDDAAPLYAAADLFVLPSIYDPASSATLEALAMGTPVITTRTNGSGEIVTHGESGWLLDHPTDAAGLAALIEAAAVPRVREAAARAGRKAVEPWSWDRHLDATLALYRRPASFSSPR